MGEWYEIGVQAGKRVAKDIDKFIADMHKGDAAGENYDPNARKELKDGSVMYLWYMKWDPYWYKDEKAFMEVLKKYEDESEDDELAYKLVASGDEGGCYEDGNEIGYDIFDGLYRSSGVAFPEKWEESPYKEKVELIIDASKKINRETSAEYLAELLMDDENSTYKMFEELCCDYINATDEQREAIDSTCSILTGYRLTTIAENLKERVSE